MPLFVAGFPHSRIGWIGLNERTVQTVHTTIWHFPGPTPTISHRRWVPGVYSKNKPAMFRKPSHWEVLQGRYQQYATGEADSNTPEPNRVEDTLSTFVNINHDHNVLTRLPTPWIFVVLSSKPVHFPSPSQDEVETLKYRPEPDTTRLVIKMAQEPHLGLFFPVCPIDVLL